MFLFIFSFKLGLWLKKQTKKINGEPLISKGRVPPPSTLWKLLAANYGKHAYKSFFFFFSLHMLQVSWLQNVATTTLWCMWATELCSWKSLFIRPPSLSLSLPFPRFTPDIIRLQMGAEKKEERKTHWSTANLKGRWALCACDITGASFFMLPNHSWT